MSMPIFRQMYDNISVDQLVKHPCHCYITTPYLLFALLIPSPMSLGTDEEEMGG